MLEVAAPQQGPDPHQVEPSVRTEHHISFHDVLSALNPLQYLPVIGTIYRAVTGDQIPDAVRRIGSIIVSGLMGGPVGVAISVGMMGVEKITGIDFDKIGQKLMAGIGIANHPATGPAQVGTQVARAATPAAPAPPPAKATASAQAPSSSAQSWSPVQLAAYGVSTSLDGTLKLANLSGADVLNSLELSRLQVAQIAYGRVASLAS
jgi:hypothetical protein